MKPEFYFLLDILLLCRLGYILRDSPIQRKDFLYMLCIQLFATLMFRLNLQNLFLAIFIVGFNITLFFVENQKGNQANSIILILQRVISLFIYIFIFSIFFSPAVELDFNPYTLYILSKIGEFSFLFTGIENMNFVLFLVVMMGFLLIMNESNLVIRFLLQKYKLVPKEINDKDKTDIREYNAGRVNGILERIIIYFFVLVDQYSAIGFVMAVKGFARFKDMDNREFAEYVLIGTLLSTLSAMSIGLLIRWLLSIYLFI